MKKFAFLFTGFLFCNLVWQIIVWGNDVVPGIVSIFLIFVFPIVSGVALYVFYHTRESENWAMFFLVIGLLLPLAYIASYATRMPDYVKFVHSGRHSFVGDVFQLNDHRPLFYELTGFRTGDVGNGEFGVSYSSSGQKSSKSYFKHFVVPVFDASGDNVPRVWLFDTYRGGSSNIDDGKAGLFGFEETDLARFGSGVPILGKKVRNSESRMAVAQYLKKSNLPDASDPLVLELVNEPAESYYGKAKAHFAIVTGLVNLICLALLIFILKRPESQ